MNKIVTIQGERYLIGPEYSFEEKPRFHRGHGGQLFNIKLTKGENAGEVIKTTNLWHLTRADDGEEDNGVFI